MNPDDIKINWNFSDFENLIDKNLQKDLLTKKIQFETPKLYNKLEPRPFYSDWAEEHVDDKYAEDIRTRLSEYMTEQSTRMFGERLLEIQEQERQKKIQDFCDEHFGGIPKDEILKILQEIKPEYFV